MKKDMFLRENTEEKKSMRDGYGEALVEIASQNEKMMVLTADLAESLRLDGFKKKYPDRFIELGIAEQNMAGIAAGLSIVGHKVWINSFAVFNPGRNWEQIRVSIALTNENVVIVGGHAGFGNGADGANQQSFEDLALMRVLPNMTVIAPVDYEQMKKAVHTIATLNGPVYLRMTQPGRDVVTTARTPFEIGVPQIFREGEDVTVVANGVMVGEALKAAETLQQKNISVEVLNIHTLKPFSDELLINSAKKTKKVIVVEEHSIIGGLGSLVSEVLSEKCPTKLIRIGMQDCFSESGKTDELMDKYEMNYKSIIKAVENICQK